MLHLRLVGDREGSDCAHDIGHGLDGRRRAIGSGYVDHCGRHNGHVRRGSTCIHHGLGNSHVVAWEISVVGSHHVHEEKRRDSRLHEVRREVGHRSDRNPGFGSYLVLRDWLRQFSNGLGIANGVERQTGSVQSQLVGYSFGAWKSQDLPKSV